MSVRRVEEAIRVMRAAKEEWDRVELGHWREIDTRYTFVDPMLDALGWNVSDPKECYPEYSRGDDFVDYALFDSTDMVKIGRWQVAPDAVVEAKSLRTSLDGAVSQLQRYVEASPWMRKGVAVLTNGNEWWIYDLTKRGPFERKLVDRVNILTGNRRSHAEFLNQWLGRSAFG